VNDVSSPKREIKRIKVIANPKAGTLKSADHLATCKSVWAGMGIEVTVLETDYAGHCRDITRDAPLDDCDALCAIGGDGTLHEMVNGALCRPGGLPVPLGFLPGGTGNSVMCDLGTWDMAEAATRIAQGEVCLMDVVEVRADGQVIACINEMCCGLVGNVGVLANNVRWLGPARYNATAVEQIMLGYKEAVRVELEDEHGEVQTFEDNFLTIYAYVVFIIEVICCNTHKVEHYQISVKTHTKCPF
jgi:diacylglycerol kinase family enzyme